MLRNFNLVSGLMVQRQDIYLGSDESDGRRYGRIGVIHDDDDDDDDIDVDDDDLVAA